MKSAHRLLFVEIENDLLPIHKIVYMSMNGRRSPKSAHTNAYIHIVLSDRHDI